MTIHDNAEPQTAELLLRTIVAVNQLSIYGAVADGFQDFTQQAEGHPSEARQDLLQTYPKTKLRQFRLSLYHVLPRVRLGTPKTGELWRNNAMKSSKIFQRMSS